jgi:peptidoglycan/xylan/chitin deacetylase (PgdA/CDA1 family)
VRGVVRGLLERARRLPTLVRDRGVILLYHRVDRLAADPWSLAVSPDRFTEQLDLLHREFELTPLWRLATGSGPPPHRAVAITFDDGYVDNLWTAKPLLERYAAPATFFLSTGALEDPGVFWWDDLTRILLLPGTLPSRLEVAVGEERLAFDLGDAADYGLADVERNRGWRALAHPPPTRRHELYLTLWRRLQHRPREERATTLIALREWSGQADQRPEADRPLIPREIPALATGDLVEIGAHTVTHPALANLTAAEQWNEIHRGKLHLEEVVGRELTSFAYPFGGRQEYNALSVQLVREAGFARACSSFRGVVTAETDVMQLPRIYMDDWDGDQLARVLSGWFPFRRNRGRPARRAAPKMDTGDGQPER